MPGQDKFIVAFYNLENLFDTVDDPGKEDDDFLPGSRRDWSEYRYLEKLENITSSIASIHPGRLPCVIGVSEIENKTVLTDLVYQPAFRREYDFVHYDSPDRRGIDVALIYNRNFFKVISREKIRVVLEGDIDFATRDILYVRGILGGSDTIHFFINHWPSRREGTRKSMPKRIAAALSLSEKLLPLLRHDPTTKVVIMGDFNDLPVSPSLARYLNAKSHKSIKEHELYNLAFIPYSKKMGTVYARGRWLMFDQILISRGMISGDGIKVNSSRLTIHFDRGLLFYDKKRSMYRPNRSYSGKKYHGGFSDHLPVYLNLEMP